MGQLPLVKAAAERASKYTPVSGQDSEGLGIAEKNAQLDALNAANAATKVPDVRGGPDVNRINPRARFGDKRGEKRIPGLSDMLKPLGSLKHGTPHVPKTGMYKLHEGEKVTPASDQYAMVPHRAKPPEKELDHVRIRKATTGGHVIEHHHKHPAHPKEEHVAGSMKDLHKHIDDTFGTGSTGDEPTAPPALGSFEHGTPSVPKTGVYKLHEGEAVTPAADKPVGSAAAPAAAAPAAAPVAPSAAAPAAAAPAAAAPAAAPTDKATSPGTSTSTSTGGATATRNTGAATGGAVTVTISGSSSTGTSTETSTETSTATGAGAGKGAPKGSGSGKDAGKDASKGVGKELDTGDKRPHVYNITINSTGESGNAVEEAPPVVTKGASK